MYSTFVEQKPLENCNDGRAKRKNTESANKESLKKKQAISCRINNVNAPSRPPRILTRRYALTKTGYKYLDIGIIVNSPSYVNIVLGDCHGKEISFSPQEWKELVELKPVIISNLQSHDDNNKIEMPPIGNVSLRVGRINNLPILRLEQPSTRLIFSLSTVIVMLDHDYCVDRIVKALTVITKNVDTKFKRFLEVAANANNPVDGPRAIRESEHFDSNDIIDCELAVLCFGFY